MSTAKTYATTDIADHPQYNSDQFDVGFDISIMELARPVAGVEPVEIYRQTPQVGQMLTLVGFGEGGNGNGGGQGDFGNKRVGTTPIDEVTNAHISWNFDNNSESNTAPGDSGGPAFVTVGGELFIAGVTSGGSNDDSSIGDFSFDTRVDVFAGWIDSVVGSTTPTPDPGTDPGADPGTDPEVDSDPEVDPGTDPPVVAGDDHGDALNSSTELSLDNGFGFVEGSLESVGDRDFFAVEIDDDSQVEIALSSVDGDLDTFLRVYDESGQLVASNDDIAGSFDSGLTAGLDAGQYFVSVGSYDDQGAGDYNLVIDAIANEVPDDMIDDSSDDSVFPDAIEMELDDDGRGREFGTIGGEDTQVFAITADAAGRLILNARGQSGDLDTMLTIYDSDGNEIAFNDDFRGLNSRVRIDVAAGETVFAEVSSYGDSSGDFVIATRLRENSGSVGRNAVQVARAMAAAQRVDTYAASVDAFFSTDSDDELRPFGM